ncbi:carboxypeptidase-like regulatory domain-containing protein [Porphyromonas levii]|uniref:carboxypeptidase-like regulatory domain-containing protein n=1 Tax=Porphyromonas levii TaxID=28114 RepID=UPI001070B145|nr:hypothetical protein E4P48_09930 [Porphyromonas levii]
MKALVKLCYLISLLYFFPLTICAQIKVSGKVTDPHNEAMSAITILLMNARDSLVLMHSMTNEQGHYSLIYDGAERELLVALAGFNLEAQHKSIEYKSQIVNFIAKEKVTELQEVVVKSQRIFGARDTVNYLVSSFREAPDLTIEDVLKRLPGVDVSKSGLISYQGKPINRFYIENMDLLQGQYGLATKSISAEDISTVQVLENHQPIKALEDVEYSNEAAINLKIKEDKKGLYSLILNLGVGYGDKILWNNESILSYFAKKRQHLFTYKTNNNGENILGQLNRFHSRPLISLLRRTSIQLPPDPPIDEERYLDNYSHIMTVNNAFKPAESSEINANIAYSYNEEQRRGAIKTTYLFADRSPLIVEEIISSKDCAHGVSGQLRYEDNKYQSYFNNLLTFSGGWSNARGEATDPYRVVNQRFGDRVFYLQNTTNWIKKNNRGKGIELKSSNAISTQPHHLQLAPGVFPALINGGENYESLTQRINRTAFISNNNATLLSLLVLGNVRISPAVFLNFMRQGFKSDMLLGEEAISASHFLNHIQYAYADAGMQFIFTYKVHPFDLNLVLPFSYGYRSLDNKNGLQEKKSSSQLFILPHFHAKLNLPRGFILKGSASLQKSEPSLSQLLTGFVLENYRKISLNTAELYTNMVIYTDLGLEYKNLFSLAFATLDVGFSQSLNNVIVKQRFEGDYSIFESQRHPYKSNSYFLRGTVGKSFEWSDLLIQFSGFLRSSNPKYIRENQLVDYLQTSWGTGAKIELTPLKPLLIRNEILYNKNIGRAEGVKESNRYSILSNHLSLDVEIIKSLRFSAMYDYYLTDDGVIKNQMSLADVRLSYMVNNVRLDLTATNLFNTKRYSSVKISDLTTYSSEHWIRPRAIMFKVQFQAF